MTDIGTDPTAEVTEPATPPLTHYHHLGLTVCDVDRSEAWYGEVLGLQRAFVEPHHLGTGYAVVLTRPGTGLFLGLDHHESNEAERFGEHRTGLDHVAFAVERRDDLDRWAEHLDRLGVTRGEISVPHGAIGEAAFATLAFRDPDNIQLELIWMP
jgi:glyoxylase I family protein